MNNDPDQGMIDDTFSEEVCNKSRNDDPCKMRIVLKINSSNLELFNHLSSIPKFSRPERLRVLASLGLALIEHKNSFQGLKENSQETRASREIADNDSFRPIINSPQEEQVTDKELQDQETDDLVDKIFNQF